VVRRFFDILQIRRTDSTGFHTDQQFADSNRGHRDVF